MRELLAALPPLLACVLMVRGVPAQRAAAAALVAAAAALVAFPTPWTVLLESQHRALMTALEVALVTLGGLLFREVLAVSRTEAELAGWIAAVSPDPVRRLILVTLGAVPLTESAAGFGVGAIVGTSLLMRLGFGPPVAALAALLGLVAVPWGGLAPGTLVAARLSGVSFQRLGELSAVLSLPVFLFCGFSAAAAAAGARRALDRAGELTLAVHESSAGYVQLRPEEAPVRTKAVDESAVMGEVDFLDQCARKVHEHTVVGGGGVRHQAGRERGEYHGPVRS